MSQKDLPDYYAILGVTPSASELDIIHAYRHAKLAFSLDSLAVHGLFDPEEIEAAARQVEEAYQVLGNPDKRREYDTHRTAEKKEEPKNAAAGENLSNSKTSTATMEHVEQLIEKTDCFTGAILRHIRQQKGLSLSDIAEQTHISKYYLQAIEEENVSHFPEMVYLKGYLRQYAHELGIEPERILRSYPPLRANARQGN